MNVPGIIGAEAGIKFVKEKGTKKIYEHEMRLVQRLFDALEKTDSVILYTPRPETGESAPLLSFNIAGIGSEKTARLLDSFGISVRAGLHCSPSAHMSHGTEQIGTVRVCPSVFTTEKEIDYFIKCTDKIAKKTKL